TINPFAGVVAGTTGMVVDHAGHLLFVQSGNTNALINFITVNHVPTVVAELSPLLAVSPNETNLLILAPNNTTATVTLDGSQSSDADNDPLQFSWYADGQTNLLATGPIATNQFSIGPHTVTVAVSDGHDNVTAKVSFEVITPATAVGQIVQLVETANLKNK